VVSQELLRSKEFIRLLERIVRKRVRFGLSGKEGWVGLVRVRYSGLGQCGDKTEHSQPEFQALVLGVEDERLGFQTQRCNLKPTTFLSDARANRLLICSLKVNTEKKWVRLRFENVHDFVGVAVTKFQGLTAPQPTIKVELPCE
jgi:hypothetical protein